MTGTDIPLLAVFKLDMTSQMRTGGVVSDHSRPFPIEIDAVLSIREHIAVFDLELIGDRSGLTVLELLRSQHIDPDPRLLFSPERRCNKAQNGHGYRRDNSHIDNADQP